MFLVSTGTGRISLPENTWYKKPPKANNYYARLTFLPRARARSINLFYTSVFFAHKGRLGQPLRNIFIICNLTQTTPSFGGLPSGMELQLGWLWFDKGVAFCIRLIAMICWSKNLLVGK